MPFGQLVFLPDGAQLPADFQSPNGQVQLHYHRQDFSNVLDILRNEKPVFLISALAGANHNRVQSISRGK